MEKLALLGGKPLRTKLFAAYNTIGAEEKAAVMKVLDSGNLSQYIGAWHHDFYGGPAVREFEAAWADFFRAKHAVSVNSNTSGLFAAMGAIGILPGDEVIVSPYTMSASAIAPVVYGGVPVFADVDPDIFCISPEAFRKAITPRTKAILIVHIFGHPADMDEIMKIANEHKIIVVEDCAQVPGGHYKGRPLGTIGAMGVFSLNYHKHIHTGEGGVVVTNSDYYADRLHLIRNHGENVVEPKKTEGDLRNTWGFNFRLPEIEAAIGIEQLKKLPGLNDTRVQIAEEFSQRMKSYPGLTPPVVREGSRHVYYVHAVKVGSAAGIKRTSLVKALSAELPSAVLRETAPLIGAGYVRPLYLAKFYQEKLATCSFNCSRYEGSVSYRKGLCPVAERMHYEELFTHEYIRPSMSREDIEDFFRALDKVYSNIPALQQWERSQA